MLAARVVTNIAGPFASCAATRRDLRLSCHKQQGNVMCESFATVRMDEGAACLVRYGGCAVRVYQPVTERS